MKWGAAIAVGWEYEAGRQQRHYYTTARSVLRLNAWTRKISPRTPAHRGVYVSVGA